MANKTSLGRFRNAGLIEQYWEENGHRCELTPYLSREEREELREIRETNADFGRELHHILIQPQYKVEYWSNVIILEDYSLHQVFGHKRHFVTFSVLCLYAKWRKAEFDVFELNASCKKPSITNQILYFRNEMTNQGCQDARYFDMCEEMLATLPDPV